MAGQGEGLKDATRLQKLLKKINISITFQNMSSEISILKRKYHQTLLCLLIGQKALERWKTFGMHPKILSVTFHRSDTGHVSLVMNSPRTGAEFRTMESSLGSWHGILDLIKCPLASHCALS